MKSVLVAMLLLLGASAPATPAVVGPDPARFTHPGTNAYFPLTPGLVTRLRGTDEGERLRETVRVTHRTRLVQGIRTTVVLDVVRREDGSLAERTSDWYAVDESGTVWYFGEATATYEGGHVESREGSWLAGRDGARAGVVMPAHPHAGQAYRQEFRAGHAEDQAWIVGSHARAEVPAGSFRHVVRSFEWSRLEPHVVSLKKYAAGVGIIAEKDVAGGDERFELVSVRR